MKRISKADLISKFVLLIIVVLMISLYSDKFGSENILVGITLITALLMFLKIDIGISMRQAPFVILGLFFLIVLASSILHVDTLTGFLLNCIFIFIMVYLSTERMEAKSYLPFMLCYLFIQGTSVSSEVFWARMASIAICGSLVIVVYYLSHRKKPSPKATVQSILRDIDMGSERFIFAVKLSIGVSLAMFLGSMLDVNKAMWIGLTVFSLTQPAIMDTWARFKVRMIGTIIGMVIFVVLFIYVIPPQYQPLAVLLFGYIYMFAEDYGTQMVFVTINALASAVLLFDPGTILVERIVLIVLGFAIALIVNKVPWQSMFKKGAKLGSTNLK